MCKKSKFSMLLLLLMLGLLLLTGFAFAEGDEGIAQDQQINSTVNMIRDKATKFDAASGQEKAAAKATLLEAVRNSIANARDAKEVERIIAAAVTIVPLEAAAIVSAAVRAEPAYAAAISGAAAKAAPDLAVAITTAAVTGAPSRAGAIQKAVTEAAPGRSQEIYIAALSVPGVNPGTLVAPVNSGSNTNVNAIGTASPS